MPRPRFAIEIFERLESTNDSLHRDAAAGAAEGRTHIAREQTRGRGRGEHTWWSPAGAGLWMSTLLRPRGERRDWGGLALVAGAATRSALEDLGVRDVELYWPNDLYVGRRKLGGILCEARQSAEERWVVVGIGVNIDLSSPAVRYAMPPELLDACISMVEAGPPRVCDPRGIAVAILGRLFSLYARFERGESLARLVGEDLAHCGQRVEVDAPGRPAFFGRVLGLAEEGELLVRDEADVVHSIRAGQIDYWPREVPR